MGDEALQVDPAWGVVTTNLTTTTTTAASVPHFWPNVEPMVVPLFKASHASFFNVEPEGTLELPIFCGLQQMALNKIAFQPLTKDLNVNITIPTWVGSYTALLSDFQLGAVTVVGCDTKVKDHVFSVEVPSFQAEILSLEWSLSRNYWPHFPQNGSLAPGKLGASFNVSLDLAKVEETSLDLKLNELDVDLGAYQNRWFYSSLTKLIELARPVVSLVLQHETRVHVHDAMQMIRSQGGCSLLKDGLQLLNPVTLQFETKEPITEHVPLVGDVDTSVNSTRIDLPKSMKCMRAEFNGTVISFHIEDFSLGTDFTWSYRKEGSQFWHNNGTGSLHAKVGISFHVDLQQPDATDVQVGMPELTFQLQSEYDAWVYKLLSKVVSPFVKSTVNHIGSYLATYEIKKTLMEKFRPIQY